jgi:hypothetical protein
MIRPKPPSAKPAGKLWSLPLLLHIHGPPTMDTPDLPALLRAFRVNDPAHDEWSEEEEVAIRRIFAGLQTHAVQVSDAARRAASPGSTLPQRPAGPAAGGLRPGGRQGLSAGACEPQTFGTLARPRAHRFAPFARAQGETHLMREEPRSMPAAPFGVRARLSRFGCPACGFRQASALTPRLRSATVRVSRATARG